jgi:hypothetical protein
VLRQFYGAKKEREKRRRKEVRAEFLYRRSSKSTDASHSIYGAQLVFVSLERD